MLGSPAMNHTSVRRRGKEPDRASIEPAHGAADSQVFAQLRSRDNESINYATSLGSAVVRIARRKKS
jgi:hypothetical protein